METGADPSPEGPSPTGLGVVIPTLNEEDTLPRLLDDLAELPSGTQVVVADGGSTDTTLERAREGGALAIPSPPGRALQMNVGACCVDSDWLLFIHADSRIPRATLRALLDCLREPPPEEAAHFAFRLEGSGPAWRLIEWGQRTRERLTGLVYGDQGLLVSRRRWAAMGGIPEMPLMEDVEAVRSLRATGGIHRIDAPIITSARRYGSEGATRAVLRNLVLMGLYQMGVPAARLARWYPPRSALIPREEPERSSEASFPSRNGGGAGQGREPSVPSIQDSRGEGRPGTRTPVLLVFAKAPRAGSVKTRLAIDVGEERAALLYRRMGSRVAEQLRGGPFRVRVCFTPCDAEAELVSWLGTEGLEFRPQSPGDLGTRMSSAFQDAFTEADRVCVVGTDAPDVDRALVEEALSRLDSHDAVFGPAMDGGYYLLALRRPVPRLFHEIPWSTRRVLAESLQRAEELGLLVAMLPMLNDIDRVEDLPPQLLKG